MHVSAGSSAAWRSISVGHPRRAALRVVEVCGLGDPAAVAGLGGDHPEVRPALVCKTVSSAARNGCFGWIPVLRRNRRQRRGCADSGRSPNHDRSAQVDPKRSLVPTADLGR